MMNNNLMIKAIEAVLRADEVGFGKNITFNLISCPDHYYGQGVFKLRVTGDTINNYSMCEYLLKWNEEENRFMTSSEF